MYKSIFLFCGCFISMFYSGCTSVSMSTIDYAPMVHQLYERKNYDGVWVLSHNKLDIITQCDQYQALITKAEKLIHSKSKYVCMLMDYEESFGMICLIEDKDMCKAVYIPVFELSEWTSTNPTLTIVDIDRKKIKKSLGCFVKAYVARDATFS